MTSNVSGDQTYTVPVTEINTSGYFQPVEQVCPKCGYCSHCGRTPEYTVWEFPPYPYNNPTYTLTAGGTS